MSDSAEVLEVAAPASDSEEMLDRIEGAMATMPWRSVTVAKMCEAAGVRKTVLYKAFGDRSGVLSALVDRRPAVVLTDRGDPEATLAAWGEAYLLATLDRGAVLAARAAVAEGGPIAARVAEMGRGASVPALRDWFEAQGASGQLAVDEPMLAVDRFLGLLVGDYPTLALLGIVPPLTQPLAEARARLAASDMLDLLRS